jgi:hypothetical protein
MLNVLPPTLEFKPGESLSWFRLRVRFEYFRTPHFRTPYLTKKANQLCKILISDLVALAHRHSFSIFLEFFYVTVFVLHHNFEGVTELDHHP